ncbi:MAG: hypothetical protein AB8C13_03345 [Phycisphaerales bacterium]
MDQPAPIPETPLPEKKTPKPKRRRRKWISLCSIPIVLVVLVLILATAGAFTGIIVPIIERQIGLDITQGSVALNSSRQIELRNAILRAPDINGTGGEIITLDRATISVDWSSILSGARAIKTVRIVGPRFRVSQDTQTGSVNLQSMRFQQSSGGGAVTPAIEIVNGVIEVGEHTGSQYTKLKELSVAGSLAKPNHQGIARFNLSAVSSLPGISSPDESNPGGLGEFMINGTLSSVGVQGEMTGLQFEDWPAAIVPSRVRDLYESLALSGNLAPTKFSIDTQGQPRITLILDGVDVSMPFIPLTEFSGPEPYLRMRSTKGTIKFGNEGLDAKLEGDIDDLLYTLDLNYKGISLDSAFDCDLNTSFRVQEGFRPLRFLPENVTEKLDLFVGLEADIDATVSIARAETSQGGAIEVSGKAVVSNGTTRYVDFMYPVQDLTGTILFTPDSVTVQDVTAAGPTGAKFVATGAFDGLGEMSDVEIVITATELPIDDILLAAMDTDQRELVDTLFSRKQYNNLLSSGYLLLPKRRAELIAQRDELASSIAQLSTTGDPQLRDEQSAMLASINTKLRVPEFEFAGMIGLEVTLRRDPMRPANDRWTTGIVAKIPNAGIVPKQFPLPIVARDVMITVEEGAVVLSGGRYEGLSGGIAEVNASFKPVEGFKDPLPYVEIMARQIPIDERLIAAIPGYYDAQPEDPSEVTLRRILDRLRMQGLVAADAKIGSDKDGRVTYEVEAGLFEGSAYPLAMGGHLDQTIDAGQGSEIGLGSVEIKDMLGTIHVTESLIVVYLDGRMESPSQPITPTSIELVTQLTLPRKPKFGNVKRVDGLLPFEEGPPAQGPEIFTEVRTRGLDLAMPLEHAIAVFSPGFANRVIGWRNEYSPDGVLDMQSTIEGRVGGSLDTRVQINQINSVGFEFEEHRYQLGSSIGALTLTQGTRPTISSRGFSIPFGIDDEAMGEIGLSGSIKLAQGGRLLELEDEPSVTLSMDRGKLGSPGVRAIVNRMGSGSGEGAGGFFDFYGLDGDFDLLIDITPIDGARFSKAPLGQLGLPPVEIDGAMIPRTLSMERDGEVLRFDRDQDGNKQITGKIRFDGLEGYFDQIRATNDEYTLSIDGQWAVNPGNGAWIDMNIAAKGDVFDGPIQVVLPDTLNTVVDQLQVMSSRDTEIERLHIVADRLGTSDSSFKIEGAANVLDVSAVIGVPITEFDGRVEFFAQSGMDLDDANGSGSSEPSLVYRMDVMGSRLRAGLLRMHNAQATIANDPDQPGVVLVPELRAGMHGGMVSGNAQIRPNEDGQTWYSTEIRASGVRAAPIFDDLFLPVEGLVGPPGAGSSTVRSAWNVDDDVSRGILNADLALSAPIGNPDQQFGRGYVRVSGGSVVALPGLINLIEASNFALPTGSRLNLAEAELYIDGPTASFERLSASSQTIEILGYGTMDWTSRDIDLRFRSRSIDPIPVLSNLIEGLRDELITIRVSGAPGSITYSAEQFGTTRRILDSMFGTPETEQQRRLREVQSRTRVGSGRLRGTQDQRIELPTPGPAIEPSNESTTNAQAQTADE